MFIESSAKAGFNIKALFRKLATALPGIAHRYVLYIDTYIQYIHTYIHLYLAVQ